MSVGGEVSFGCLVGRMQSMRTLVESLEVVELRSEAALAGGVDDEDDFALVLGEREGRFLVVLGGEVVE
jgi:hypothetical protein